MNAEFLDTLVHRHDTGVVHATSEKRTRIVVAITMATMVAELVVGQLAGSMALTADGWHMATHAGVLGMSAGAYWFARTRSGHARFTFGTGKVYALAGYTSAVALAIVALWMAFESVSRLLHPEPVVFAEAFPVAILGLLVNLVSIALLGHQGHDHGHDHSAGHGHDHGVAANDHGHDHGAAPHAHAVAPHLHEHEHRASSHAHDHGALAQSDRVARDAGAAVQGPDHNLRAAYVHIMADALTSVLAIASIAAGHYLGWWMLDPLTGLVGGGVIIWWAVTLIRDAARQLLDVAPSDAVEPAIRAALETIDDVRVVDFHLWDLGPQRRACIVALATATPRDTSFYRAAVLAAAPVTHLTVEVHRFPG